MFQMICRSWQASGYYSNRRLLLISCRDISGLARKDEPTASVFMYNEPGVETPAWPDAAAMETGLGALAGALRGSTPVVGLGDP
jgi:hypothetical protein